ncbi:MAG: hypothetical protein ACXQS5_04470, partial [Candidatus Methanospirareceae archaeon]
YPMHVFGTSAANPGAWEWFTTTFFIAFAAFTWIGYNIARKFRAEEILFICGVMRFCLVEDNLLK